MPEPITKYKTKYGREFENEEEAIDYENIMDIGTELAKKLGFDGVDMRSSKRNGIIKLILEKRTELSKFLGNIKNFNENMLEGTIYCNEFI